MNNFLNKVVEWIALRKIAVEKNKSCVSSSQIEKHVTIKTKISKNNTQCSYARIKLEEMKAKFEAERSGRIKKLELKNRKRHIQEQIEELQFQQRGKKLEILEKRWKHKDSTAKSFHRGFGSDLLKVSDVIWQQKDDTNVIAEPLKKRMDINEENSIKKNTDLELANGIENMSNEICSRFGWTINSAVTCFKDKIKRKYFQVSKIDIKVVKEKIESVQSMNFIDCYCRINYTLASCRFTTLLSSTTVLEQKEIKKSVIENTYMDFSAPAIDQQEEKRPSSHKAENIAFKELKNLGTAGSILYLVVGLVHMHKLRKEFMDDLHVNRNRITGRDLYKQKITEIDEAPLEMDKQRSQNLPYITSDQNNPGLYNSLFLTSFEIGYKLICSDILPTKIESNWILWLDKICTLKNYKYPR